MLLTSAIFYALFKVIVAKRVQIMYQLQYKKPKILQRLCKAAYRNAVSGDAELVSASLYGPKVEMPKQVRHDG